MASRYRIHITVIAALIVLAALAAWSLGQLRASRARATLAARDAMLTSHWAGEIEKLRGVPGMVPGPQIRGDQLDPLIHRAAGMAGIEQQQIQSIRPLPPRPLRNSRFQQVDTELSLTGVTIEQVVRFAHELVSHGGLQLQGMQLGAPTQDRDGKMWNVTQLVLSHYIEAR